MFSSGESSTSNQIHGGWKMILLDKQMVVLIGAKGYPNSNHTKKHASQAVQGGPLPVISGVISPINGLING